MVREAFRALLAAWKRRQKYDTKAPLPVVRYTVYLLIATTVVTGASLARYATTSAVSEPARVAKLGVVVTHNSWNYGGTAGVIDASFNVSSKTHTFTVTNNGEVAVGARLVIDSSDVQPTSITPAPSGGTTNTSGWVYVPINSSKSITVVIPVLSNSGTPLVPNGNNVKMHIEYEQID